MNFREIDKIARKRGCIEVNQVGSHHHYTHPEISGKLTIPEHGGKDLPPKVVNNILKWLGLK